MKNTKLLAGLAAASALMIGLTACGGGGRAGGGEEHRFRREARHHAIGVVAVEGVVRRG